MVPSLPLLVSAFIRVAVQVCVEMRFVSDSSSATRVLCGPRQVSASPTLTLPTPEVETPPSLCCYLKGKSLVPSSDHLAPLVSASADHGWILGPSWGVHGTFPAPFLFFLLLS